MLFIFSQESTRISYSLSSIVFLPLLLAFLLSFFLPFLSYFLQWEFFVLKSPSTNIQILSLKLSDHFYMKSIISVIFFILDQQMESDWLRQDKVKRDNQVVVSTRVGTVILTFESGQHSNLDSANKPAIVSLSYK